MKYFSVSPAKVTKINEMVKSKVSKQVLQRACLLCNLVHFMRWNDADYAVKWLKSRSKVTQIEGSFDSNHLSFSLKRYNHLFSSMLLISSFVDSGTYDRIRKIPMVGR